MHGCNARARSLHGDAVVHQLKPSDSRLATSRSIDRKFDLVFLGPTIRKIDNPVTPPGPPQYADARASSGMLEEGTVWAPGGFWSRLGRAANGVSPKGIRRAPSEQRLGVSRARGALTFATPVLVAAFLACVQEPGDGDGPGLEPMRAAGVESTVQPGPRTRPGTREDWKIMREKARWAYANGLDTLPIGRAVAHIGEQFVGTPYAPHTLEVGGEERLVIEFQEFDCVTFVEASLALARFVHSVPEEILDDPMARYRARYSDILQDIRYRNGTLDRYPSRLHYFSEWISDNQGMGIVRSLSRELGGVPDDEPIDFMTTHSDAYQQLREDPALLPVLGETEARLNTEPRYYVPEDRIAQVADGIRDGDIIAATSTVAGLDVAHTGIAVWRDGTLHLLHAPLVDGAVEVSERSLAERVRGIAGQDGIMVARPLSP